MRTTTLGRGGAEEVKAIQAQRETVLYEARRAEILDNLRS